MQEVNEKLLNIIDRMQLTIDLMLDVVCDLDDHIDIVVMNEVIDECVSGLAGLQLL